jgi:hypothetical protein
MKGLLSAVFVLLASPFVVGRRVVVKRSFAVLAAALIVLIPATVSSAAAVSGWSKVPTPNPLAPTGQLFWVSCPSATTCMAVGTYVDGSGAGLSLAERWNGTSWSRLSTPNPAGAAVSFLLGVSCTSASACIAVGEYFDGSGAHHAFAERWNGASWSLQSVPEPSGSQGSFLSAVSCSSAAGCTAVGSSIESSTFGVFGNTLAEHWDGTSWSIQSTPNPSAVQYLSGISCVSSTACVAVGQSDQGTVAERWDGTTWSIQSSPSPGQNAALFSVACTSVSACMAVGNYTDNSGTGVTLAEQWDGTRWSVQTTPNASGSQFDYLNSVSCTASSACTAVGASFDSSDAASTVAERWDGQKWSLQATPNAPGGSLLIGVACTGASACTAVGYGNDASGVLVTLAQGWDGTQWSAQPTVNVDGARGTKMYAVDCKSPVMCMAVGQSTGGTTAQRWDGMAWRVVPTPNAAGAGVNGLFSVSCTLPSFCIAVGAVFDSFNSGNSLGTITERWDGTSWRLQATPTTGTPGSFLNAVSCTSPSACTAVGSTPAGPAAERWNGSTWSLQSVPQPDAPFSFLTGVACTSAVACIAVGGAIDNNFNSLGTVAERWDGTSWSLQSSPTSASANYFLNAVSCTSSSACTAVGNTDSGLLAERWDGTSWTVQSAVTPAGTEGFGDFFSSVSCSSPSSCTAVGLIFTPFPPFTIAERWDGNTWTVQDTAVLPGAYDIDPPGVSCVTISMCTLIGGYTNNGPKVTLAEQWNRDGGSPNGAAASSRPATTPGLGSCLLPVERASLTVGQPASWGQRHLRRPRC